MSIYTITIKELTSLLGLTDTRSVKRWCRINGVAVLTDNGRRSSYVIGSEFEAARTREFINILKKRHGSNWLAVYEAHVNFDIELLSGLRDASRVDRYADSYDRVPSNKTSGNAQRFRTQLLNIIRFTATK